MKTRIDRDEPADSILAGGESDASFDAWTLDLSDDAKEFGKQALRAFPRRPDGNRERGQAERGEHEERHRHGVQEEQRIARHRGMADVERDHRRGHQHAEHHAQGARLRGQR